MEYNEQYSRVFKHKLLDTFKFTVNFLEKHNLKYWACGGTCLGAARHQGFIPWDDDIDIMMPRDDYYKLLDLRDSMKGSGYSMACNMDDGYYYDFGKIMDDLTTIVEYRNLPFVLGVYVDVYPVYQTDIEESEINKLIDYYQKHFYGKFGQVSNQANFSDILSYKDIASIRAYFGRHGRLITRLKGITREKLYHDWSEFEKQLNKNRGERIVSYIEGYYGHKTYQKEWFDNLIDLPFEDTTIKAPREYDKYLTYVFGDYMKLPPEDQRVSLHNKYYTNLCERLDISEIIDRVAKGETIVY